MTRVIFLFILSVSLNADICVIDEQKIQYEFGATTIKIVCINGTKWLNFNDGDDIEQMLEDGHTSVRTIQCVCGTETK